MYAVVNGEKFDVKDTKELLSYLWQIPLQHAKYSPLETVKENVVTMCDLMIEALLSERKVISLKKADNKFDVKRLSTEKAFCSRLVTRLGTLKRYAQKKKSVGELLSLVYEMIMSLEGKSLLPGFGFCKKVFKDPLKGNPEKNSIMKEV